MNKQLSLSFVQDELTKAKTNETTVLAQMDQLVPWGEWVKKFMMTNLILPISRA